MAGCAGPGYYVQAASGQLKLMRARQEVTEVLADPDTDPGTADRLRAAREMLRFAESELSLRANDSYSTFVRTGKSAVVWNVIVAPEFSLEARKWCFPVAGCVPYRGYFEESRASAFAQRMAAKGLDVSIQAVTAYSTLGWFSDPLLDTMLQSDNARLAGTLFHELAHQRLYLKGDTAFSEAYASFVEQAGVEAWLSQQDSTAPLQEWRQNRQASQRFRQLQAQTRNQLEALYRSDLSDPEKRAGKQRIFDDMAKAYEAIVQDEWGGRRYFGGWMAQHSNNAALALFRDYQQGLCAFESLFESAGGNFGAFHELVSQQAGLPPTKRALWLSRTC